MNKTLLGFLLGVIVITLASSAIENYTVKKNTAEVLSYQNVRIFTDCTPVAEYEYLGTVKGPAMSFSSGQYEPVRDGLIKRAKKEYPQAEGIILILKDMGYDRADVIRFK